MKFAVYSSEGASLTWQRRLMDEGHEVLVHLVPLRFSDIGKPFAQRDVGMGIVPREASFEKWCEWGRGGIYLFDSSGHGVRGELLRARGERVIGSGKFCDRIEDDREFGVAIAKAMGIAIPDYVPFGRLSDAIAHVKKHGGDYVFKSNRYLEAGATYRAQDTDDLIEYLSELRLRYGDRLAHILQSIVPGIAVSTARWWNGMQWVGPYEGTIEHKKLLDGDHGPSTGCAFNFLWFYEAQEPRIAQELNFEHMAAVWRRHSAPPGIYDINAILADDGSGPRFLEFTPRLGYDAEPTSQRGIANLGAFLEALAGGAGDVDAMFEKSKAYMSVRVTVPPYPAEHFERPSNFVGRAIRGEDGLWDKFFLAYGVAFTKERGLHVADPEGLAGMVATSAEGPEGYRACYRFLDERLRIRDVQCRRDAEAVVRKDLAAMTELGYETS